MRHLVVVVLALLAAPVQAGQCYYYWFTDCFEIRDARSRDIVHHVLLGQEPHTFEAADGQCEATAASLLDAATEQAAVKRFNKVLKRLDGCKTLTSLSPRVYADGPAAFDSFRKHAEERAFKQVHTITRIPLPGGQ